jgi:hypothetical protein
MHDPEPKPPEDETQSGDAGDGTSAPEGETEGSEPSE